MKLTEWFPADVKPVHVGVYEICHPFLTAGFAHWNGSTWSYRMRNLTMSADHGTGAYQDKKWRGLAEKPE